jgi:hypothetical protein
MISRNADAGTGPNEFDSPLAVNYYDDGPGETAGGPPHPAVLKLMQAEREKIQLFNAAASRVRTQHEQADGQCPRPRCRCFAPRCPGRLLNRNSNELACWNLEQLDDRTPCKPDSSQRDSRGAPASLGSFPARYGRRPRGRDSLSRMRQARSIFSAGPREKRGRSSSRPMRMVELTTGKSLPRFIPIPTQGAGISRHRVRRTREPCATTRT